MAIVTFPGGLYIPAPPPWTADTPSSVNTTLAGAAHKLAMSFAAPKTGTLSHVGMRYGTLATATHRMSFQSLSAAGVPDGVVDQFITFTPTASVHNLVGPLTHDGTGGGTKRTVTRGERLAVVLDFSAYTSGTTTMSNGSVSAAGYTPHMMTTTNGTTWTRQGAMNPQVALQYDDGTYAVIGSARGISSGAEALFASDTGTFDERGIRFTVPAPLRLSGCWWTMRYAATFNPTFNVVLYEDTTAVVTDAIDAAVAFLNTTANRVAWHRFSVDTDLVAGPVYRLTLQPTTTVNVTLNEYTFPSAAARGTWDGGLNMQRTARLNLGSFTDTDTVLPEMGLYVTGIDDGTGGGPSADTATGGRLNRAFN